MGLLIVTKVGIDGIESMVSIYFSMIFRFEKCHRYIKHVSNFEPKNFDTQSESSLKHRYQKACIVFKKNLSIPHLEARNYDDIKGHVSFSSPKSSIPYLKARNYDDITRHTQKLVFHRVSKVPQNPRKTRSKQEEGVTLLQRRKGNHPT